MNSRYHYINIVYKFLDGSSYNDRIMVKDTVPLFIIRFNGTEYYKLEEETNEVMDNRIYTYRQIYILMLD